MKFETKLPLGAIIVLLVQLSSKETCVFISPMAYCTIFDSPQTLFWLTITAKLEWRRKKSLLFLFGNGSKKKERKKERGSFILSFLFSFHSVLSYFIMESKSLSFHFSPSFQLTEREKKEEEKCFLPCMYQYTEYTLDTFGIYCIFSKEKGIWNRILFVLCRQKWAQKIFFCVFQKSIIFSINVKCRHEVGTVHWD